ncbi:Kelch repeat-containing protein, partial [Mariniradius saccharolyticus]|uniref:Kelch repeat-containing protein n=1 Tax=Mariniradius saccharolyticus TaxID=1245591 RepID=UPI00068910ED
MCTTIKRLLPFLLFIFISIPLISQQVPFNLSNLSFNGFIAPEKGTSLQFGPDGRLYVSDLNGQIKIYSIEKTTTNSYRVIGAEVILDVQSIPNHDDIGTPAWDGRSNRQVTGIVVVGTQNSPIIYVSSSDPKWGGPNSAGGDRALDTNSGVITRLTKTQNGWETVDIVRGLPRSEENHSTNGMEHVEIQGKPYLLVTSGGFTNAGAPSRNFAWITEYALSAAVLSIDLQALEEMPINVDSESGREFIYDLPTLDDPSRPNKNGIYDPKDSNYDGVDVGDPFGGNDGLNMGMLVEGGPVQIFSGGYRNAFDIVVTESGSVYVTDNGPNPTWGGLPIGEGNPDSVSNDYAIGEPGATEATATFTDGYPQYVTNQDQLLKITTDVRNYSFGSFYGGHPTPIRANPGIRMPENAVYPFSPGGAGLFTRSLGDDYSWQNINPLYTPNQFFRTQILEPIAPGQPGFDDYAARSLPANWPPVPISLANPLEADYIAPDLFNPNGPQPEVVAILKRNSNAIAEYRSNAFQGTLKGSLIIGRANYLHLVHLTPEGTLDFLEEDKFNVGSSNALGIYAMSDEEAFPGTIWVASFNNMIRILTPADVSFCPTPGDLYFDPDGDYDGDGFSNQDELDNGTDYCSGGSRPEDFDGDFESDLNDLDDDDDGIIDAIDPFQLGSPSDLPIDNELFSDKSDPIGRPFGYRGLGLTGLMNNGSGKPNWLAWLDSVGLGPMPDDIFGGAAGAVQLAMTEGTANGEANSLRKGFQFGVNIDSLSGTFWVTSNLLGMSGPQMFYTTTHEGELGIQIGDGSQSNFVKLVFTNSAVIASMEIDDIPDSEPLVVSISETERPQPNENVNFMIFIDPSTGKIFPKVRIGERDTIHLGEKTLVGPLLDAVQATEKPLAIGFYGSSGIGGTEFLATYDNFKVFGEKPYILKKLPSIQRQAGSIPKEIILSSYFDDNDGESNLSYTAFTHGGLGIEVNIDDRVLRIEFPSTTGNDTITVRANDSKGYWVEQQIVVNVLAPESILYRINAGGNAIAGINQAPNWQANHQNGPTNGVGYVVDSGVVRASNFSWISRHSSIPDYIDEGTFKEIFEDYFESANGIDLTYTIPINPGNYKVRLFLGIDSAANENSGDRVFRVLANSTEVVGALNIHTEFGKGVAGVKEFDIEIPSNELVLTFQSIAGNALIHGIELIGNQASPALVILESVGDQVSVEREILDGTLFFKAEGGFGALQYDAENLPPGVEIEPVNGRLFGTLAENAAAGSPYNVTLWVRDSNQPISNQEFISFKWTVNRYDSWKLVDEDTSYTGRHENSFVQAGKKFYLMGGREKARNIDVYDFENNSWKTLVNVGPLAFNHFQAVEYRGYIWIIGAFENNSFPNETPASHIWVFDPITEQYTRGPEIPVERRRGSAGLVVYKDKFYLIGGNKLGHNGQYVAYFDEFDPLTGSWRTLADAPRARDHFHASVIGDKIFVASGRLSGGEGGTFGPVIKEVDVWDFETGTWSTLPSSMDLPTPRAAAVVSAFDEKLYVVGGEIPGPGNDLALNVTEIFDPKDSTWTNGPSLNFGRHGTQGIISGGGLYVIAGSPTRGGGNQKKMEVLGLDQPVGIVLVPSSLQVPDSVKLDKEGNGFIAVNASGGNQAVIIKSVSFGGADSGEFIFNSPVSQGFTILPDSTFQIGFSYVGTKKVPAAHIRLEYGTNSTVEIPIIGSNESSQLLLLGLKAHWKMEEGGGQSLIDHSGNG